MLEHSIYSVISPEGCAAILWRSSDKAPEAAEALRFTAEDLKGFKLVDEVIEEPLGGAHRGRATTIERVGETIERHLSELAGLDAESLRRQRRGKFLAMGRAPEA
jgi:acetyl-CoA carboxylase carboxyl transferase subunit alpha